MSDTCTRARLTLSDMNGQESAKDLTTPLTWMFYCSIGVSSVNKVIQEDHRLDVQLTCSTDLDTRNQPKTFVRRLFRSNRNTATHGALCNESRVNELLNSLSFGMKRAHDTLHTIQRQKTVDAMRNSPSPRKAKKFRLQVKVTLISFFTWLS